ncbi:FtsX-like permease family protein [candidate division KSB1 bacterium]|nr:FtsX-like permease family protein [candidate division KSB1 bacterium]
MIWRAVHKGTARRMRVQFSITGEKLFIATLKIGIISLRSNPLRSFLAILGVVIGVAAVISVVAFGEGHRQRIQNEIAKWGSDVFWIQPVRPIFDSSETDHPQRHFQMQFLNYSDLISLRHYATKINRMAAFNNFSSTVFLDNHRLDLNVVTTEPSYEEIGKLNLISGRFLTDFDIHLARRVCVVEYTNPLKKIFAVHNPSESYISINNLKFKIIGLVEKKSETFWSGFGGNIYIPISTLAYLNSEVNLERIYCQTEPEHVKEAMAETEQILKSKYRGEKLFEAYNAKKMFKSAEKLTRTASLVTAGIAMISLLVGSIGIMNIMLVTVTERTREIGARKAVGAKKRDIRNQFLGESILLTLIGGAIGTTAGILLAKIIGTGLQIPVVISVISIIIGIVFSVGIGIISGFYPAYKASKLHPIEALRYE